MVNGVNSSLLSIDSSINFMTGGFGRLSINSIAQFVANSQRGKPIINSIINSNCLATTLGMKVILG